VVKLFQADASLGWIDSEARRSRLVHEAGLPTPWVGDIVEVGSRKGIIYERLDGPSLDEALRSDLSHAPDLMRHLAEIHYTIHCAKISGLPSQRAGLRRAIEFAPFLSDELRRRVLDVLQGLPDGESLCHGDLNTHNIVTTPGGWKVIDWDNASLGNPMADVERSVLMLDAGALYARSPEERAMIEAAAPPARDAYIARYLEQSGGSLKELTTWRAPLAAARLREGINEEERWLLEQAQSLQGD